MSGHQDDADFEHVASQPVDLRQITSNCLRQKRGKHVLLNVRVEGQRTSVCVNIEGAGSASWRRKEKPRRFRLDLKLPGFSVIPGETICLSYADVNDYASNFRAIHEAIAGSVANQNGEVAIGTIPSDSEAMGRILTALEAQAGTIRNIHESLDRDLNTPSLAMRKSLQKSVQLMFGDGLSEEGVALLNAFDESRATYESLPELTGFGTNNIGRNADRPGSRGGLLRYYMQHNQKNPLSAAHPLDFVGYELKPLNISDGLRWNCDCDPRTDSVDLLLSFENAAVLTEVKMAGDAFVSAALVQLLYYASTMANERQRRRLKREFPTLTVATPWLCVIVEQRDEGDARELGFSQDVDAVVRFLRHEKTSRVLGQHYRGVFLVVIREERDRCDQAGTAPAFRSVAEREFQIRFPQG